MHLRIAASLFALLAAMFVQVGLCPNCTFGVCGDCERPAPMPQMSEETHSCCKSGGEMKMQVAMDDEEQQALPHQCDGECSMKRSIEDRLWSYVKAYEVRVSTPELLLTLVAEESFDLAPTAAEHESFQHPPPRLHFDISTTVLQL